AQAAMRHSDIDLTMNTYTDPRLLDVHGAVQALPELPLNAGQSSIPQIVKATGTDSLPLCAVAPVVAPTSDISSNSVAIPDNMELGDSARSKLAEMVVSGEPDKRNALQTAAVPKAGDRIRTGDVQLGNLN